MSVNVTVYKPKKFIIAAASLFSDSWCNSSVAIFVGDKVRSYESNVTPCFVEAPGPSGQNSVIHTHYDGYVAQYLIQDTDMISESQVVPWYLDWKPDRYYQYNLGRGARQFIANWVLAPYHDIIVPHPLSSYSKDKRGTYFVFHWISEYITACSDDQGSKSVTFTHYNASYTRYLQYTTHIPTTKLADIWSAISGCPFSGDAWNGTDSGGYNSYNTSSSSTIQYAGHLTQSEKKYYYPINDRQYFPKNYNADPVLDKLVTDCVSDLQLIDINSPAFLRDLYKIRELLPPISAVKNLKSIRSWGQIYLWYRYGVKLTVNDVKTIIRAVKQASYETKRQQRKLARVRRSANETVKYGGHVWSVRYGCEMLFGSQLSTGPFAEFANFLRKWDLNLNLHNLWDMVPLSFVLDWFIPLGSWFEQLDAAAAIIRLPIVASINSEKWTTKIKIPDPTILSDVTFTCYKRIVSTSPRLPLYSWQPPGLKATCFFDGAALVASGGKKSK